MDAMTKLFDILQDRVLDKGPEETITTGLLMQLVSNAIGKTYEDRDDTTEVISQASDDMPF